MQGFIFYPSLKYNIGLILPPAAKISKKFSFTDKTAYFKHKNMINY